MSNNNLHKPISKYLIHNGMKSHYIDWSGTGPTALLVHGGMRTSRSFDAMARVLHKNAHVLALDLIGHGDSTWNENGYTWKHRSEDVYNFITHGNLNKVCGIGHSMGAVAIALCAEKKPERFEKLILMEPVMKATADSQEMMASRFERPRRTYKNLEELKEVLQNHPVTKNWASEVIEDVVQHETFINHENRVDIKWSPATNSRPERESDHMDLKPVLENIAVPILLVIGGSRTSEFEEAFSLAEKVTNIETVVISDTGHNMYMERPQAVAEVARKFLQSDKVPKII